MVSVTRSDVAEYKPVSSASRVHGCQLQDDHGRYGTEKG